MQMTAWQLLIGIDIDFTDTLSLDIGYRYFDASSWDGDYHYNYYYDDDLYYDYHYHDGDDYDDDASFDFDTAMFTLGFRQRF